MAEVKAGYGDDDFSTGGSFNQGRLSNVKMRCTVPKSLKGGKTGTTVVVSGRDGAGAQQELWLTLGGDADEAMKKFKPGPNGLSIIKRTDAKPAASSKYGLFMKSLREADFPMSRFEEEDFAALDGCSLDIDSKLMTLSANILEDIKRKGKQVPTYYVVTAFELPSSGKKGGKPDEVDHSDKTEDEEAPEDRLEAFIRKALKKAGEAVELKVLASAVDTKFDGDDDLDKMVDLLDAKSAWLGKLDGITYDKKAKTLELD